VNQVRPQRPVVHRCFLRRHDLMALVQYCGMQSFVNGVRIIDSQNVGLADHRHSMDLGYLLQL